MKAVRLHRYSESSEAICFRVHELRVPKVLELAGVKLN